MNHTTQTAPDVLPEGEMLPLDQLMKLGAFRQVEPEKVFGEDFAPMMSEDRIMRNTALPYVRTFDPVGNALYGQPVDSWARLGAHYSNRIPEFQNFTNLTEGLSPEKKVRCFIILVIYAVDMSKRNFGDTSQSTNTMFNYEALSQCQAWIQSLLDSADIETKQAVANLNTEGVPEDMTRYVKAFTKVTKPSIETPISAESKKVDVPKLPEPAPVEKTIATGRSSIFKRLVGFFQ